MKQHDRPVYISPFKHFSECKEERKSIAVISHDANEILMAYTADLEYAEHLSKEQQQALLEAKEILRSYEHEKRQASSATSMQGVGER